MLANLDTNVYYSKQQRTMHKVHEFIIPPINLCIVVINGKIFVIYGCILMKMIRQLFYV